MIDCGYVVSHGNIEVITKQSVPELVEILVVREFTDIFLAEVHELLLFEEVEFAIDLLPNTMPICRAPY